MTENDKEFNFTDAELLAYLDGESDPELTAQIKRSPTGLKRAQELARLQSRLTAELYRLECPRSETLGEYQLALLDQTQAIAVARHLQVCPHCTREMIQMRDYLGEGATSQEPGPFKGIRVLIARLVSEIGKSSLPGEVAFTPAYVMLRGGAQRPVILEADGLLINLDIQPVNGERVNIVGQVAAEDQDLWTDGSVELRQDGILQCESVLDDLGAFRCDGTPTGPVELVFVSKSGVVVLANIEVVV